jgi:glycosyltransferase 2 family protein
MRRLIFAIVLFLGIAFVFIRMEELQNIGDTLQKSNWIFLGIAISFECLWLYNLTVTFGALYHLVGLEEDKFQLFLMATAANFVNVVAPTAGMGGIAVFLDCARRRNISTGKVLVAGALYVLYDYAAMLCILITGFVVLIRRNNLHAGELIASLILLALALAMTGMLYLGYKSAERLGRVLAWLARLINRILRPLLHREYLKEENARIFAQEIAQGISMLRGQPRGLMWPFLLALSNKAILICVLAFTCMALGVPVTVGTIIAGVSIIQLFMIISPTPSGVGIVESVTPFVLSTLQVPWAAAVLITLIYRAITFWMPVLVGGIAFRILGNNSRRIPSVSSR